jgi:glycosyltransferase involved in cell wall biosynthesis
MRVTVPDPGAAVCHRLRDRRGGALVVAPDATRVCFVTERYPPQLGGVAIAARRVVGYLVEAGFRVRVIHPFHDESAQLSTEHGREGGAAISRLRYPTWNSDSAVALLRLIGRFHSDRPFDLFHGFFLTVVQPCAFVANRLAAEIGPRPVIASIRGSDALMQTTAPYWRDLIRDGLQNATWITSVNQFCLGHVARELDVDLERRASVIRNGVAPVSDDAWWRLNDANRGVIGTVGVFRMLKDIPLLVRGYAGLPAALRSRLLLAGYFDRDAEDERLWSQTLVEEFGLEDQIEITGRFAHAEVGQHLGRMHVCVHASAYEGLPNSLLEAAARGVPIVATDVGGMGEVLTDGENGLLVPHGDPVALTRAIRRVVEDDALAQRLSAGGMRLANRLSESAERAQWVALYRTLLARGRRP